MDLVLVLVLVFHDEAAIHVDGLSLDPRGSRGGKVSQEPTNLIVSSEPFEGCLLSVAVTRCLGHHHDPGGRYRTGADAVDSHPSITR